MAWFPESVHCLDCEAPIYDGVAERCEDCAAKISAPASDEIVRLEKARKMQEVAWYRAGYSREQITAWFAGWPKSVDAGYPTYEWTVGDPVPRWGEVLVGKR